ncbi:hypothetical protein [Stackebrandtia nassauensis]|uniref:Uncharacterized protein n=1 Tax=Stackebrandtia nassauensis (strain DSM 44728 / CIP 108903 / NRRL B-16338 / NBRC 102104 / LLR-40K-21) TaxID=446470 RepID=D3QB59_STANL|nr:hypothetical protein [Stackebrandtia nassauensis]ADD40876.1 hypothetical protein Snas_1166 [Stackebrandtia nassauensis DSM 44728]
MASTTDPKSPSSRRLTIKIVASLVVGALTYFITEELLGDNKPMAIMTSVFMAGVIFVAQFLYDVDSRMTNLGETMDSHLDNVELKLNSNIDDLGHGAHLVQLLAKSRLPVDNADGLVRDAIEVDANHPELAASLAKAEMVRLGAFMRELRYQKTAAYQGEDRDWLLTLADKSRESIKAISLATVDAGGHNFVDGGLWRSDLGIRYLDLQEMAILERKVRVQRIFVSDLPDDSSKSLLSGIVIPQRDLGIEVRVLHPERIRGTAASKLHDFIVFDDQLVYETTAAARRDPKDTPRTLTTKITVNETAVKDAANFFTLLWDQAEKPADMPPDRD